VACAIVFAALLLLAEPFDGPSSEDAAHVRSTRSFDEARLLGADRGRAAHAGSALVVVDQGFGLLWDNSGTVDAFFGPGAGSYESWPSGSCCWGGTVGLVVAVSSLAALAYCAGVLFPGRALWCVPLSSVLLSLRPPMVSARLLT